ncbi:MAG: nucleotidyltransferase family protein [Clostridium sp.]|nr:nucleotidyltransferase family protein [Clostridium sp.]
MTYSSAESEYLVELIKSAIMNTAIKTPPKNINWGEFVSLAKKQQVYSIIAPVLSKIDIPDKQAKELQLYNQNELLRLIAMKNELEQIEEDLSAKGIDYMLVKGSVIRNFYPQQKMRQMSDIDILYDYSKRDALLKIMKAHGFRLTTSCENSDDFFKEPFYTFEWHRELFFEEAEFCPHFDLWKNALADDKNPHKYAVESTEHFVYTICHMYKHYATNGCGIRFLCDIYVLMQYGSPIDMDRAVQMLEDIKIKEFAVDAIGLTQAVFHGTAVSDNQQKMMDFLLDSGVYGNLVIDYSQKLQEYNNSKRRYILKRLFPEKKKMTANYRALEKRPYLLPYYYIVRLFTKFRYNSKSMKKELRALRKIKR